MTGERKKTKGSRDKAVVTPGAGRHANHRSPVGRYEDQMTLAPGTVNSDNDPVRDAQETLEDAAILKRFRIMNLVGTGNYARVYRALSHSGKELAIKSINLRKTSENYKFKFLPRELTILRKISHGNICKIHEIIHIADRVFIVMQFCHKGTIADLLHRFGPISEPVARYLFVPTVDAVNYLHSLDLAHRDLKVENILLDSDYTPKLTDFSYSVNVNERKSSRRSSAYMKLRTPLSPAVEVGSKHAHLSGGPRLNDTFCGTLPYLSPEMIKQIPYDPKKTDIWSLGICLYVMLNDRLPFPFNDVKLMVKRQLTKDFKFKAHVEFTDQCRDLVNLMLEPEFTKRIGSQDICKHVWLSGPRERPQH